ncbi:unnamed protein product [Brachionus calyciflorus]|uniref:Uncharacterized protein n=1 Tax=Brachionus calyciflorus TaxID=104777 RepID=A0A813XCH8_9BILA|nr:unnamed protein product [Brachionus calyciflorus]
MKSMKFKFFYFSIVKLPKAIYCFNLASPTGNELWIMLMASLSGLFFLIFMTTIFFVGCYLYEKYVKETRLNSNGQKLMKDFNEKQSLELNKFTETSYPIQAPYLRRYSNNFAK